MRNMKRCVLLNANSTVSRYLRCHKTMGCAPMCLWWWKITKIAWQMKSKWVLFFFYCLARRERRKGFVAVLVRMRSRHIRIQKEKQKQKLWLIHLCSQHNQNEPLRMCDIVFSSLPVFYLRCAGRRNINFRVLSRYGTWFAYGISEWVNNDNHMLEYRCQRPRIHR